MNKKIEKPNYTQTPNILFDEIMRDLNGAELKVILAVIRKTFGWHKERDRISLTQLEEMTGLSRQGILNAIHGKKKEKSVIGGLVNKGYIKIIETKQGNVYELVVKEVDQQETASQLSRLEVVNKVDQESGLTSQQSRHTKETYINKLSKENNSEQARKTVSDTPVSKPKKAKVEKPDSVSQETWDDYLILRKQKRAPVTNTVLKGLEREAGKAGLSLEKVMQLCVERGWQGFSASWVCDEKRHRIASDNMQGDDYKKYCTFIGGEE